MIWVKPETPVRSETVFPSGPAFLKMNEMLWNGVGPTLEALCVRGPSLVTLVKVARPGAPSPPLPGALTSFDP
jgi:hypothetical protein